MTSFISRNCPACGSAERKTEVANPRRAESFSFDELRPYWRGLFKEKLFFSYDRCASCGLLYAPVFLSNEQLTELYSSMEPNMDVVPPEAIEATQRGYFADAVRDLEIEGGYLEIGPDVGHLVRYAADLPKFDRFWLFEPNLSVHAELADATGGRPSQILSDMTDLSVVPDGSVALAVMVHVLDHLLDPADMLRQIRAKLKPGGRLVIVTHNERSILRTLMGNRWPPFCLQHPELYNPQSVAMLLERTGYGGVQVKRSTNYFPISFLVRQAAWTLGADLSKVPLPMKSVGLKLGNMMSFGTR